MQSEIETLKKIFPTALLLAIIVIGFQFVFRGLNWSLLWLALGLAAGVPLLDMDKVLAKYIETKENIFHQFAVYPLLFFLAVFVITASGSAFGRGMVISLMLHAASGFSGKFEKRLAFGLLGLICLLAIFA